MIMAPPHESAVEAPSKVVRTNRRQSTKRTKGLKRYTLTLPEDLFDEIHDLAERRQTTVVDLLRRFIKLGLIAANVDETDNAALIIREGDSEREIVFI